jgi:hypothetical protein
VKKEKGKGKEGKEKRKEGFVDITVRSYSGD